MPTIDVLGVPHAYNLTPAVQSRTTLVFVHGWLLSRSYWQPLVERLFPYWQCLTYDLRGFGESRPSQHRGTELSGYSLVTYAQDLGQLLAELNLSQVWLVGHSLGGSIALWAADQWPTQVKGVICVNAGGGIYMKEEFERFRAAGRQLVKWRAPWLRYVPLLGVPFMWANVTQPLSWQWGWRRLADLMSADSDAALGSLLESTTESEVHQLPQIVSRLQQPVYFIAGDRDRLMEPQYVHYLASFHWLFQEASNNVVELPECGHLAMLEQTDRLAEQIKSIVSQYDALETSNAS